MMPQNSDPTKSPHRNSFYAFLAAAIVGAALFTASPASAEGWGPGHCWWDGGGMRCVPGWGWNREHRREEWRERHEDHERMERREWCDRYPAKCW